MFRSYIRCLLLIFGFTNFVYSSEPKPPVYELKWEKGQKIGKEWNTKGKVMVSPNDKRILLGGITDEAATSLNLKNLPSHKVLTIEIELFLVGTWDGSNEKWGQDKMNISLQGENKKKTVLLDTTFSNCMANNWSGSQHYPEDMTGRGRYNCFTGISYIGELGYRQVWKRYKPTQNVPIDSTYKLKFSVPHTNDSFTLNFQSEANEAGEVKDDQNDQWYGIGDVKVTCHNEEIVDEKQWAEYQKNLLNPFIPISNHAFWEMMRYPSRFRADYGLMKEFSNKTKWWYPRAERLLLTEEKKVNK